MKNNLRHLRKAAGFTQGPLAKAIGTTVNMYGKLERGERDLTSEWIDKLAKALHVDPSKIVGDQSVAVVGRIGAGGTILYEDTGNDDLVSRPPDTDGPLVGLEVVGDSMLPKFDSGDIIYIGRSDDGVDPEIIGAYCACRLVSGETYLKILARGSQPNRYTLRSLNAADMENRELLWATPVRAILPRLARRY